MHIFPTEITFQINCKHKCKRKTNDKTFLPFCHINGEVLYWWCNLQYKQWDNSKLIYSIRHPSDNLHPGSSIPFQSFQILIFSFSFDCKENWTKYLQRMVLYAVALIGLYAFHGRESFAKQFFSCNETFIWVRMLDIFFFACHDEQWGDCQPVEAVSSIRKNFFCSHYE